jgi:beta-lactamase regulating signal transducer with metallopeptidase domain
MTMGLLLYVALVLTLAALAGWALETLSRQFGRPARWAWLASTVVAFTLVARATLTSSPASPNVSFDRVAMPAAAMSLAPAWSTLQAVRDALTLAAATIGSVTQVALRAVPARATTVAFALWLSASLISIGILALVHLRFRRARRGWAEADLFGTRVRIAPAVGPAVVGVARPQIVVPRWLLGRSADEQQLVLAHEREHLDARDHLLLAAGSLAVALVPWHPAAWWMLARLRLAIELDCDARVLRRGVPARTYGKLLIDLADRCTGFRVGATALADEGSHLERRLLAMKTNRMKRPLLRAGMLGTAAALALLAACEAKVPTGPEIDAMDVAGATKAATGTRFMMKSQMDSAIFYVDGKEVEAKTANSLMPNQIATIDISKGNSARSIIRISTNGQAPLARGQAYKRSTSVTMHGMPPVDTSNGAVKARIAGLRDGIGNPLILIDGVKADNSQLQALDRNRILSIEVLKGDAAQKLSSDPAAKNGIITVTTKK